MSLTPLTPASNMSLTPLTPANITPLTPLAMPSTPLTPAMHNAINVWVLTIGHAPEEDTLEDYLDQLAFDIDAKLITVERDIRYITPHFCIEERTQEHIRAIFCSAVYDMYADIMPPHMHVHLTSVQNIINYTVHDARALLAEEWEISAPPALRYAKHPLHCAIKNIF